MVIDLLKGMVARIVVVLYALQTTLQPTALLIAAVVVERFLELRRLPHARENLTLLVRNVITVALSKFLERNLLCFHFSFNFN